MKRKPLAALAIAAALLAGTAAPAAAVPRIPLVGHPCDTFHREAKGRYLPVAVTQWHRWTLLHETRTHCYYKLVKSNISDTKVLSVSYPTYKKISPAAGGGK